MNATHTRRAWLLLGLICAYLCASADTFATVRMSPAERDAVAELVRDGHRKYAALNLEFADEAAQSAALWPAGMTAWHRFQRFAGVFLPLDAQTPATLERLENLRGLVWLELATPAAITPPPAFSLRPSTGRGTGEPIVRGGWVEQGRLYQGQGVLIGLIDTGLDIRNADFITCDAEGRAVSRVRAFWDTTRPFDGTTGTPAPIAYPDGTPLGTVFSQTELTAALRASPRVRAVCPKREAPRSGATEVGETDTDGHGTAVAGIAAGSGRNAPDDLDVKGVAPAAELLIVRAGTDRKLANTYLLSALLAWLDAQAGPQPLVIVGSFSELRGGHDGASIAERELDALFPLNAPGRAVVLAAGNRNDAGLHTALNFGGAASAGNLTFMAIEAGAVLEIYADADITDDWALAGTTPLTRYAWTNPLTGQTVLRLTWPQGAVSLTLSTLSGRRVTAHAYLQRGSFANGDKSVGYLTGRPGTASHALSVGSYDWNEDFPARAGIMSPVPCGGPDQPQTRITQGRISYYSSPGPRRDGVTKPELAAPGQFYRASYARNLQNKGVGGKRGNLAATTNARHCFVEGVDRTGYYLLFDGTSAATPYTAGVLALLLEKNPKLTMGEIKALLRLHLSQSEARIGATPNALWGYGQLDLPAVKSLFEALDGDSLDAR